MTYFVLVTSGHLQYRQYPDKWKKPAGVWPVIKSDTSNSSSCTKK